MNRRFELFLFGILLVSGQKVYAQQSDQIVLDPQTGDYRVTYCCDEDGQVAQVILVSAKKIDPKVQSLFHPDVFGLIQYSYVVSNGVAAPKAVVSMRIDPVADVAGPLSIPATWQGLAAPGRSGGFRVSWRRSHAAYYTQNFAGVPPGRELGGFGLGSSYLPGVVVGQFESDTPVMAWPGEGLSPDSAVGAEVERIETNFVARHVAAPTFGVASPFNARQLLEEIKSHIQDWPQRQLMDAALWNAVVRNLTLAIDSFKARNTLGALSYLTQIQVELRKKYPDLGASTAPEDPQRLAARVLDFDVAFVSKKSGTTANPGEESVILAPQSETMHAPPQDSDGTFVVQWSTPFTAVHASLVNYQDHLVRYELEQATKDDFADANAIYSGTDNYFRTNALAPGTYWFRVRALLETRVKKNPDDPTRDFHWTKYFVGPHTTRVLPVPVAP